MNIDIIKGTVITLLILITQVLVLNNIHLFGCATPLLLVYIIITLPTNTPQWASLVLGFVLGLISDIFLNTPGVAASSLTLVALLQPMLLQLFTTRETNDDISPSISTLGFAKFMTFSIMMVLIYSTVFFLLEEFNFFHWQQWLLYILGSTVLTCLFILTFESLRRN